MSQKSSLPQHPIRLMSADGGQVGSYSLRVPLREMDFNSHRQRFYERRIYKTKPMCAKNVHKKLRGRPKGSRYAGNIPCRLPPKTLAAVDELAARDDVTRSEAIRRLIEIALACKAKRQNTGDK